MTAVGRRIGAMVGVAGVIGVMLPWMPAAFAAPGDVNTEIRISIFADGTNQGLSTPDNLPAPAPGSIYGGAAGATTPNAFADTIADDQITAPTIWDAGEDSATTNNIVRTFDQVIYRIEWNVNEQDVQQHDTSSADEVIISATLPDDVFNPAAPTTWSEVSWLGGADLPVVCKTAGVATPSGVSADGRTLTCNLGTQRQGTTGTIYPLAKLNGSRNGTAYTLQASITTAQNVAPVLSNKVTFVASARPQWNVVKPDGEKQCRISAGPPEVFANPGSCGAAPPKELIDIIDRKVGSPTFGKPGRIIVQPLLLQPSTTTGLGTEPLAATTAFNFIDDFTLYPDGARMLDFQPVDLPGTTNVDESKLYDPSDSDGCRPANVPMPKAGPFGDTTNPSAVAGVNTVALPGTWTCVPQGSAAPNGPGGWQRLNVTVTGLSTSTAPPRSADGALNSAQISGAGQVSIFIPDGARDVADPVDASGNRLMGMRNFFTNGPLYTAALLNYIGDTVTVDPNPLVMNANGISVSSAQTLASPTVITPITNVLNGISGTPNLPESVLDNVALVNAQWSLPGNYDNTIEYAMNDDRIDSSGEASLPRYLPAPATAAWTGKSVLAPGQRFRLRNTITATGTRGNRELGACITIDTTNQVLADTQGGTVYSTSNAFPPRPSAAPNHNAATSIQLTDGVAGTTTTKEVLIPLTAGVDYTIEYAKVASVASIATGARQVGHYCGDVNSGPASAWFQFNPATPGFGTDPGLGAGDINWDTNLDNFRGPVLNGVQTYTANKVRIRLLKRVADAKLYTDLGAMIRPATPAGRPGSDLSGSYPATVTCANVPAPCDPNAHVLLTDPYYSTEGGDTSRGLVFAYFPNWNPVSFNSWTVTYGGVPRGAQNWPTGEGFAPSSAGGTPECYSKKNTLAGAGAVKSPFPAYSGVAPNLSDIVRAYDPTLENESGVSDVYRLSATCYYRQYDHINISAARPVVQKAVLNPKPRYAIGDLVTFELNPAVLGANGDKATNIVVEDSLPAGLKFVSATGAYTSTNHDAGASTGAGGYLRFLYGTKTIYWGDRIQVVAEVVSGAPFSTLTNWVIVRTSDRGSSEWASASISLVGPYEGLTIAKQVVTAAGDCARHPELASPQPGWSVKCEVGHAAGPYRFTLNLRNTGLAALSNLRVIDVLPFNGDGAEAQTSAVGTTPPGPFGDGRQPGSNFNGTLAYTSSSVTNLNGTSPTATMLFTADSPATVNRDPDAVSNGGTVGSTPATLTTWCSAIGGAPVAGPGGGVAGTGTCPATAAAVTAVTWVIASMPIGANYNISLVTTPSGNKGAVAGAAPATCSWYTNTFGARTSTIGLPVRSNDVTVLVSCADVRLAKAYPASPKGVALNQAFPVDLTITNDGPDTATNVVVSDQLPAGMQLVSGAATPVATPGALLTLSPIASIASGQSATVRLIVKYVAAPATPMKNYAEVSKMDQSDTDSDPKDGDNPATSANEHVFPSAANLPNEDDEAQADIAYLGDRVWNDNDRDGFQDVGEVGIGGVTVELFEDADGDGNPDGPAIATTSTKPDGTYGFVLPTGGSFVVRFDAATLPPGMLLTAANAGADDAADSDADQTTGRSASVTVPVGTQNLTVDAGAYYDYDLALVKVAETASPVTVGAQVTWKIRVQNQGKAASGQFEVTDTLPTGMTLVGACPSAVTATTGTVACSSSGQVLTIEWSKAAAGLATGEFVDFTVTAKVTSTAPRPYRNYAEISNDSAAELYATVDNDSTPDAETGSDTAAGNGAGPTTGGAPEPQVDIVDLASAATDNVAGDEDDSDQATLELEAYAVGDLVWFDAVPDGIRNPTDVNEVPVAGTVVTLFNADNTEVNVGPDGLLGSADDAPGGVTTLADGRYYFDGLPPGEYYITFSAPTGYVFTTNTPATPDAANDSNPAPLNGRTPNFTLTSTTPAVSSAEGDPATLVATRIDRTIDAGLIVKFNLGNRVWFDADNSGAMEGADPVTGRKAEVGVGDVVVNLLRGDGTPLRDAANNPVFDMTDGDGFYRFDGLLAGDYIVEIAASNFLPGGPLAGGFPSTGALQEADPDTGVDANDNGLDVLVAGAIRSGVLTLGPTVNSEPTGEVAAQLEPSGQGGVDARSDMTVDFGIYVPTYSVGNIVWLDVDRDGIQDGAATGEVALPNVVVKLFRANGTEVPVGPDGVLGTADDAAGGVTTGASGAYYFDDLPGGEYYVTFTAPSADFSFTTNTPATPDALNDSNADPVTGKTPNFVLDLSLPPVSGVAGDPATLLGDRIDRTIDAGLIVSYSIGNRVWFDVDNSGDMNGTEAGAKMVLVNLLRGDSTPFTIGGVAVTATTDDDGFYRFDNLPAGDYIVEIAASNFAPGAKLYGGHSSTGAAQEADPDTDVDTNDNGLDVRVAGAIRSAAVTLGTGVATEPTGEDGTQLDPTGQGSVDARANMTLDFGIWVPRYTLGNLIWSDYDNDGTVDPGEAPISGVRVQLLMDDPSNPGTLIPAVDADNVPVGEQTTGLDGTYAFTNLLQGTYVVVIPGGQAALALAVPSGSPNANANDDVDGDNNAMVQADGSYRSGPVVLGPLSSEPTNEVDGLTAGTPDQDTSAADALHNSSVDFGFFRGVRIGNTVWLDGLIGDGATYDNGVIDPGETPLGGVSVELWSDNGDGVFDSATDTLRQTKPTDGLGNYAFEGLTPGAAYFVAIETIAGPTVGLGARSSTGQSATPGAADNDDDGAPVGTYAAVSAVFNAPAIGAASTGETDIIPGAAGSAEAKANTARNPFADANSELRLDFGFVEVPIYRLGNLVWEDLNRNGIAEVGEPALDGVRVELYDELGGFAGFTNTVGGGKYLFENLTAGKYEVRIPTAQAVLRGYFTSTADEANADLDGDGNDNGTLAGLGAYWTSGLVALGNGDFADEPINEVDALLDGTTDDDPGSTTVPDDRSNMTVDFAFYRPLFALGNEVWLDLNNNGVNDDEPAAPAGVIVNLLDGKGDPYLDDAGNPVTTQVSGGRYLFDGIYAGVYIVEIASSNFAPGGLLERYKSSPDQTVGDAGADDRRDHGDDDDSDGVRSVIITLAEGTEPVGETPSSVTVAPDANANTTIDFGFVPRFAIGNEVWIDLDNSGQLDNLEAYVPDGVVVNLLYADETPVLDAAGKPLSVETVGGQYVFDGLLAGKYIVELAASNFAPGGKLVGYRSSTADGADDGTDRDDNGAPHPSGAIHSGVIELSVGLEPTAENPGSPVVARDNDSDLTIDFGVVPLFAIGNDVWVDIDNSGNRNGTEPNVPDDVIVNLLTGGGTPVLDAAGNPVTTTTLGGKYLFDGLVAGDYMVELDAANFVAGGKLYGYRSSNFTGTDNGIDGDDNGAPVAGGSIRSASIKLGAIGAEPVNEDPNSVSTAVDSNADMTVDFGLVPLFAIGSQVWFDIDDSGDVTAGEGSVPDGVVVNLLNADTTPVLNSAGDPVSVPTAGGRYLFDNLPAGDYIVELAASNFAPGGRLEGYRSSTGQTTGDALTDDGKDHGDDNESDGVRSAIITLRHLAEPVGESPNEVTAADDPNANMSADFGIVPLYALGNQIWFDLDNSGTINGTEPPVPDDVIVNLLKPDGTPVLDAAGDPATTKTVAGRYVFDGLLAGKYIVEIAPANFASGGLLYGYRSSATDGADNGVDGDDNGSPDVGGGIRSAVIELGGATPEPTAETPTTPVGVRDANADLTIDFGIVPSFSIGNQVWFDLDNDGKVDSGEPNVPNGVKVNLLKADGTALLDAAGQPVSTTTDAGKYLFGDLLAGTYIVELDASNFVAGGLLFSTAASGTAAGDTDVDQDNNGSDTTNAAGAMVIRSGQIVLSLGAEPLLEDPDNDPTTRNENENLTVDFGVVPRFSIGNQVWLDVDDNGKRDDPAVEPNAPDEVIINLLNADLTPVLDAAGQPVTTTTTSGLYLFSGLLAGSYVVEIAPSNFAPGGKLATYRSSTPNGADDDVDGDDNGSPIDAALPFSSGVRSGVIVVAPTIEPTGETPDNDTATADWNENLTVDFGFHQPKFSFGNQIWIDLDGDGQIDPDEPTAAPGIVVSLYDLLGAKIGETTTDNQGQYLFAGLPRGDYYVEIQTPAGYRSPTLTETGDVDGRDHGSDATTAAGVQVIRSSIVRFDEGTEPTGENPDNDPVTQDANENLTFDLGLTPMLSIGNHLWYDLNGNATLDATEPPAVDDVIVNLLNADGSPALDEAGYPITTRTVDGMYLFSDLRPGRYIVEVAAQNFAPGGLLEHWMSSPGQNLTPTDGADHGELVAGGAVRSGVITAAIGQAPLGETPSNDTTTTDADSDLTVDFGFMRLSVGNRVWLDTNDDGRRDPDEPGVGGVTVELWAADANGPIGSAPVATVTSGPLGYYLFDGLAPGTYVVRIPGSEFRDGGPLGGYISTEANGTNAPDPDNGVDGDDNGTGNEATGWVQTLPFEVVAGGAPTAEGDVNPDVSQQQPGVDLDSNMNLTIDLGFVTTPPFSLGNRVWRDANNDGVSQDSEPGIDGVSVQLFLDANGDGIADSAIPFQTVVTSDGGYYLFTGLTAGKYIVVIPASNFATGGPLAHMAGSNGSGAADGDIDGDDSGIESGGPTQDVRSSTVTLSYYDEPTGESKVGPGVDPASNNNSNLTVDFGFYQLGSLGDLVWNDVNRDGKQDAGEPGVDGVKVNLYDASGTLVATTTTAGGGKYLFEDLVPGSYVIEFVTSTLPDGFQATPAGAPGSDESNDSDGDPVTGRTGAYVITPGVIDTQVDFGIHRISVDLVVTKTVDGEVAANRDSLWKITVSNTGPDTETGRITVTDTLPPQLTFVAATGSGWSCAASGQVVTCTTDDDLRAGQSLLPITVTARVARNLPLGTEIVNAANVSSPNEELNSLNNRAQAKAVTVKAGVLPGTGADIAMTIAVAAALVGLGLVLRRSRRKPVAA